MNCVNCNASAVIVVDGRPFCQEHGGAVAEHALRACQHILDRSQTDPGLEAVVGYGTGAFTLLCRAEAAFLDESLDPITQRRMDDRDGGVVGTRSKIADLEAHVARSDASLNMLSKYLELIGAPLAVEMPTLSARRKIEELEARVAELTERCPAKNRALLDELVETLAIEDGSSEDDVLRIVADLRSESLRCEELLEAAREAVGDDYEAGVFDLIEKVRTSFESGRNDAIMTIAANLGLPTFLNDYDMEDVSNRISEIETRIAELTAQLERCVEVEVH